MSVGFLGGHGLGTGEVEVDEGRPSVGAASGRRTSLTSQVFTHMI